MAKGGVINNSRYRKESRCKAVAERTAYREALSPKKQLERLDGRLGVNVGAVKERKRLAKLISQQQ